MKTLWKQNIKSFVACPHCEGTGLIEDIDFGVIPCPQCGGSGRI